MRGETEKETEKEKENADAGRRRAAGTTRRGRHSRTSARHPLGHAGRSTQRTGLHARTRGVTRYQVASSESTPRSALLRR
ncbi:hypothetical protein C0Z17_13140 [Trinickia caryophylli]|nr:hypothetical protein C0Z17_13140 [Trinickia caryophylli]